MKSDSELRLKAFFASLDLLVESVEDVADKSELKDQIDEESSEKDGLADGLDDYSFPEPHAEEGDLNVWERWNEHCRDHKQRMEARGLPPRLDVFSEEPVEMRGDLEEEAEQDSIEEQSDDAQEGCT